MTAPGPWHLLAAAAPLWLVLSGGAVVVPLELPLLLMVLIAVGRVRPIRLALTIVLALIAVLRLADLAMAEVLGRGFNPVADLALADASARMIAGAFGPLAAVGAGVLAAAAAAAIAALIWWACGVWASVRVPGRALVLAGAALVLGLVAMPGTGPGLHYGAGKTALAARTLTDLRAFRRLAQDDQMAGQPGLLAGIDRDVLVIFIESYGRTSFDTGFYADTHLPTLRLAEARLANAGLAMRSGFLTAPTQGGQSWLSHASIASGLWINDQSRYQAYLASGRRGLFHHAQAAGFRTAAVMPAITRPWPEALRMGFDRVLAAGDLGYRGQPFNWVTMPDQFTLAATDRLLRRPGETPLFAQVALISSHAPWVPVPRMVTWDQVGDGRIFDAMAQAGPTPKQVWADRQRVRDQYRLAIDYALQAVAGYAELHAAEPPLLIVMGDHQAVARIALDDRAEVPIHVIGPADLVERTADWGLSPGLIPPNGAPAMPMQDLRDLILRGFGQTQSADAQSADTGGLP